MNSLQPLEEGVKRVIAQEPSTTEILSESLVSHGGIQDKPVFPLTHGHFEIPKISSSKAASLLELLRLGWTPNLRLAFILLNQSGDKRVGRRPA